MQFLCSLDCGRGNFSPDGLSNGLTGDIRGLVLNIVREVLAHLRWASAHHNNPNLAFPTCCAAIHTLKATPLRSGGTIVA